jgi:hypothetical protein
LITALFPGPVLRIFRETHLEDMTMIRTFATWTVLLPLVPILAVSGAQAADHASASCAPFMAPKKAVNGKEVGQEDCRMLDYGIVDQAKKYHRIDIGVTGTLSGYVVKDGARQNYFTSGPDFTYTQFGNPDNPRFHGILTYTMEKGTSMTLTYPETGWNGKVFIMVHGRRGSFLRGTMRAWDKYYDPEKPFDANKYEKSMLERGYAVARSRRNADGFVPGDFSAVLDDGTVWPDQNINMVPELILDKVRLVDNLLQQRLGRKASRNYWWGHSAGTYTALALNYMLQSDPSLNRDADGRETISGFIDDDPGGGLFLPILEKNGTDILYRTPDEKASFIKTIALSHQAYPLVYSNVVIGEFDAKHAPEGISDTALTNKRNMMKLFKKKGMDNVFRMYEVRGVSHSGDEELPTNKDRDIQIVHLSRVMDGVVDLLDNWVEKGIEPPASKSDDASVAADAAIALPETACPLGHYYAFPSLRGNNSGSAGTTSFAAYDGAGLEPLDGQLMYVDMNRDGRRDNRETMTQAWRRLGLLAQNEPFDRTKYVACVQAATGTLRKENLLTGETVRQYMEEAEKVPLPAP